MATTEKTQIKVETTVNAPVEKVWKMFVTPEDIIKWNYASEDWCSPKAENDLRPGGRFVYRMEAKDGSFGFDFDGIYEDVKTNERIAYALGDERKVEIFFIADGNQTTVVETFDADSSHSVEMQQGGWQAILNNFKNYVEAN